MDIVFFEENEKIASIIGDVVPSIGTTIWLRDCTGKITSSKKYKVVDVHFPIEIRSIALETIHAKMRDDGIEGTAENVLDYVEKNYGSIQNIKPNVAYSYMRVEVHVQFVE